MSKDICYAGRFKFNHAVMYHSTVCYGYKRDKPCKYLEMCAEEYGIKLKKKRSVKKHG